MKLFRLFGLEDRVDEIEDRVDEIEDRILKIEFEAYPIINRYKHDSHNWLYKNGDEFSILGKEYLLVDTYLSRGTEQKFIYLVYNKDGKYTETWTEQELREWMVCDKNNK